MLLHLCYCTDVVMPSQLSQRKIRQTAQNLQPFADFKVHFSAINAIDHVRHFIQTVLNYWLPIDPPTSVISPSHLTYRPNPLDIGDVVNRLLPFYTLLLLLLLFLVQTDVKDDNLSHISQTHSTMPRCLIEICCRC